MMAKPGWAVFPYKDKTYNYAGGALKKNWERLHKGDCEPFPKDEAAQEAWRLFHAGEFAHAVTAGLDAGGSGINAANKAANIYANYLEKSEAKQIKIYGEVAACCEALQKADPKNANAFYSRAYALGRYSQLVGVAKALTQGIAGKVKASLDTTLKLQPKSADAHVALGTYHAEIIAKVGSLVGGLTYGASRDKSLEHYQTALKLNPDSAIARIEYANGIVMLIGKSKMKEAEELYAQAAACTPMDAMERLDVELAKSEIED
jgi:tetratricopeptide (TPR) repeat protein